jgi:hypothetical protein
MGRDEHSQVGIGTTERVGMSTNEQPGKWVQVGQGHRYMTDTSRWREGGEQRWIGGVNEGGQMVGE